MKKKGKISALFLTQRPTDDWPDALDHLAIGLVANTYKEFSPYVNFITVNFVTVVFQNYYYNFDNPILWAIYFVNVLIS